MTGEEALKACQSMTSGSIDLNSVYTVAAYAAWHEPFPVAQPYISAPVTTSGVNFGTLVTSKVRTPEEIQELLTTILEWTSGLGEYPSEELAPLIGDLFEDVEEEDFALLEKVVARTLSWVLGRI